MTAALVAIAVALATGATPAPAPPIPLPTPPIFLPTAGTLFLRHSQAFGLLPVGSIRWSGTVTSGGTEASYDAIADAKGHFRQDFTLPLSAHAEGDDGAHFWQQDENGNVTLTDTDNHHNAVSRLLRLNDYKFDTPGAKVTGITYLDGRRAYVVSTKVGQVDATLYIDAASALVDGGDFADRTIRYSAYRRFEGVPVPTLSVDTDATGTTTTTVDDVHFAAPVASSTFTAPTQREPDMPAGKGEVTVPFDTDHNLIILGCTLNGSSVHLLLDSGSSTSVIDAQVAARLGMPTGGVAHINAAGELTGTVTRATTLGIGDAVFHDFVMEAVPLQLPASLARDHIDGIAGYDIFAQLVARISYFDSKVLFMLPSAFTYKGTGAVLPLAIDNRVSRVDARLGRSDPVTLTLDTGSDAALVLYREYADAHANDFETQNSVVSNELGVGTQGPVTPDLASNQRAIQSARGAGGGEIPVRVTTVSQLSLGDFSLVDLFTQVVLHATGAFAPTVSDGIVGAGALSQFGAVFIDYPGRRLILEK
ncbi:MAG TPA: retropepsin-like aspartic protease [Candidatus Eremiobacteraceae bacterium]|nr:retropepsin-like aspartic protease [Candidatus Eremiobacteraceae bacterium]